MNKIPVLRYEIGKAVAPGDCLATTRASDPLIAGSGTYIRNNGHIYASVAGSLQVARSNPDDESTSVLFIQTKKELAIRQVIRTGQVVMGRVVRTTLQQVLMEIVAVEDYGMLPYRLEGVIRREDIRTGTTEPITIADCFRPGDLVISRVLSQADPSRCLLTTAEPELGVMYALSSTSGLPMVPCSWQEMECRTTGAKENRKCARPRKPMGLVS